MQGEDHILPVVHILAHILDLARVHVGHGMLHCAGQVDDYLIVRRGLPYVQNRVADLQGVLHFRPRKALRTVLEGKVSIRLLRQLLQQRRAVHGNL